MPVGADAGLGPQSAAATMTLSKTKAGRFFFCRGRRFLEAATFKQLFFLRRATFQLSPLLVLF